ncbi:hypothetical protein [Persephonella sp.]
MLFSKPKYIVPAFLGVLSEGISVGKPYYQKKLKKIKARQKRKRLRKHKKLMKRRFR